ncbi:MAG: alpha-L-fucosidase [Oscillospiraceae bacterium]|jgi:hypothetical protein|nr:alpha-L-fucosidase [Oscillospiraceae bacterium]
MANNAHQEFRNAKWGVFLHYLADKYMSENGSADEWNAIVDSFDVSDCAKRLYEIGAGYAGITIGQNSGFFCAPNSKYCELTGANKMSNRDLVSELADELKKYGILLMAYLPSGAPDRDMNAREKLKWAFGYDMDLVAKTGTWKRTGLRHAEFQLYWEDIIREWSQKWGEKVFAWWIDGCYFAEEMYLHPDKPNFESFAEALRSGNSKALICFNPGVFAPIKSLSDVEDFTAGEIAETFPLQISESSQCERHEKVAEVYHAFSYLGSLWGQGDAPRFGNHFAIGYTQEVVKRGGVVTWDVPCTSNGHIKDGFVEQLKSIGTAMKEMQKTQGR